MTLFSVVVLDTSVHSSRPSMSRETVSPWCRRRNTSSSYSRAGKDLDLTAREYELLVFLLRHQGETVSRDMLGRELWTEVSRTTTLNNVIDVHMGRIRRKVDEGFDSRLIYTVRGVGYVLRKES